MKSTIYVSLSFSSFLFLVLLIVEKDESKIENYGKDSTVIAVKGNLIEITHMDSRGNINEYSIDKNLDSNGVLFKIDYYHTNNLFDQKRIVLLGDWRDSWQEPLPPYTLKNVKRDGRPDSVISIPIRSFPRNSKYALQLQREARSLMK